MSERQTIAVAASVVGFLLLIAGSLGYMGVYGFPEWLSYILMGIGIVAVVGALIVMTFLSNGGAVEPEEEENKWD